MAHKSGFVNIIGKPNAGKSTLLNILVGEQLAIITPKAQTTRHRILGMVNGDNHQIVFSDTPGVLQPHYKLHQAMMQFVYDALSDADIFLLITAMDDRFDHEELIEKLQKTAAKLIVIVNKIDTSEQKIIEDEFSYWKTIFPEADIIGISALKNFNIATLNQRILELLPEGPAYYEKDELTDKSERFIMAEIIREKIFLNYQKEIPYCTEVEVESFKDEPNIVRISGVIHVARDSQKNIIIGHQGKALKKVGTQARIDMEAFLKKKVFLELFVKVSKDWRDNNNMLRQFGYEQS